MPETEQLPVVMSAKNEPVARIPEESKPTYALDSIEADAPDALDYIRVKDLQAKGHKGEGEIVAVVDTGLDKTWALDQHGKELLHGWKSFTGEHPLEARHDHGTHVAGIVRRVAPEAKLLIVQVLDANGSGTYSDIENGVRWALENGATQVNCSLGGPGDEDSDLSRFFDQMQTEYGVFLGAAAGNDGCDSSHPANTHSPGSSRATCSSANTDYRTGGIAQSSSCGDTVDVAAPGYRISSWVLNGEWGLKTGTSMAIPFVVGLAALLGSAGVPSSKQRHYIESTARNTELSDIQEGRGIVDGAGALAAFQRDQKQPEQESGPVPNWLRGEVERFERYLRNHDNQAARNVLDYLKRRLGNWKGESSG